MGIEGDVVSCLYENAVVSFFQFFRVIHPFPLFTCYVTRLLFFSFLLLYHPFLFILNSLSWEEILVENGKELSGND